MTAFLDVLGYIFFIALGQALRLSGTLPREMMKPVTTLVLYVTLPCAIVRALHDVDFNAAYLAALGVGFVGNWIIIGVARLLVPKRTPDDIPGKFAMLNLPGWNVGLFAMPYTAGFLSPEGFLALCLFDVGNSLMCTGGTYALLFREGTGGFGALLVSIAKRLLTSAPILTYLFLLFLGLANLELPDFVMHGIEIGAGANTFLAMLMIGMSMNLRMEYRTLRPLLKLLAVRYATNGFVALACWYALPFADDIRKAIVLVLSAPIPAMGLIFSVRAGLDWQASANINTISILVSVPLMTLLISML